MFLKGNSTNIYALTCVYSRPGMIVSIPCHITLTDIIAINYIFPIIIKIQNSCIVGSVAGSIALLYSLKTNKCRKYNSINFVFCSPSFSKVAYITHNPPKPANTRFIERRVKYDVVSKLIVSVCFLSLPRFLVNLPQFKYLLSVKPVFDK